MPIFKKMRCQKCKNYRATRYCLRLAKNICWHDCNILRVDQKCPQSCQYAIVESEQFLKKAKADSQAEYEDLLKRQIDDWINKPQEIFDNKIPIKMIETSQGKNELTDFFNSFKVSYPPMLSYLKSRLSLPKLKVESHVDSFENVAMDYLDHIIAYDWEDTIPLLYRAERYESEELKSNYLRRLNENKFIKKIKSHELIASALSEDKNLALVFFEVNEKHDFTIALKRTDTGWYVIGKIAGRPELFNEEVNAMKQVAVLLSKNELENARMLLEKYEKTYFDSADLNYYWGLYYVFNNEIKNAKRYMLNAFEIDPGFVEAKYNYGYLYHGEGDLDKAKEIYTEILKTAPKEPKTLNNLGAIYMEEGKLDEAEELLKRCLEIDDSFEMAKQNLELINKTKEQE